jgi:hypothetical protein
MAGLRPIGSEKLEGMEKLRRIMEIARYKENIPQSVNETKSTEYKISLADGNSYEIVKERQGYIIKQNINESETEYIEPMQNRKYYSSYSQALKRLNLMTKEINTLHENEEGTSLLGEQKKKFILKTKKPKTQEPIAEPAPVADVPVEPIPPAGDLGVGAEVPPAGDLGAEVPPAGDLGAEVPSADTGVEGEVPAADTGVEGEVPAADMGAEEEMPDFGGGEEMDVDVDVEEKPREKKVSDIKRIQILVGKLSQKIRSYEEEKELSAQNVKYIINSILSAIDVDVLDEDDIEEIISKLEGGDEDEDNVEMEDMEVEDEEEVVEPEVAPEPPAEPEMGEGYDSIADAFQDYMGGAYANVAMRNMQGEKTEEVYEADLVDDYHKDRRKGRKHFQYPQVDTFSHGTFNESSVDKVLSKYFTLNENDQKELKLKQERKTSLVYKQNKENVIKLSESADQLDSALDYISKNPRVKLMGMSNKGNLIFKEGINEVKITRRGDII